MSLAHTLRAPCVFALLLASAAPAAAQQEAAAPKITGSAPVDVVRKVVKAGGKKLRQCYEERLKAKAALEGKLTVTWTINADGTVKEVGFDKKGSTIDDRELVACLASVIKSWSFPKLKDGGLATVAYPFLFSAASVSDDTDAATGKVETATKDKAKKAEVEKAERDRREEAPAVANTGSYGAGAGVAGFVAPSGGAGRRSAPAESRTSVADSSGPASAPSAATAAPTPSVPPPSRPAEPPAAKPKKAMRDDAAPPKGAALGGEGEAKPMAEPAPAVRERTRVVEAPALKAGRYDDNKQYNRFLEFLRENKGFVAYGVDVSERLVLRVLDRAGKSMPNCAVEVKSMSGKVVSTSTTYADGNTQFFPADASQKSEKDYSVSANCGQTGKQSQLSRTGRRVTEIRFDSDRVLPKRVPVDIAIVIDTTGSMQSQIDRLKKTLQSIHYSLTQLSTKPDIRFALVAYRDRGDDYVTAVTPFTDSVDAFQAKLDKLEADGGGDTPEDMQSALEKAMKSLEWRKDGIRLGFVISDAPPHTDYGQKYTYAEAMREALKHGIKWITVGAGGLSRDGEVIFRQVSQFTMGEYVFVTESGGGDTDGGVGEASHHVGTNYTTENLDQAIVRIVRRELSYLTDEPRDFDYTVNATVTKSTPRDDVLGPAVAEILRQLADYSAIKLAAKTPVAVVPVSVADKAYEDVAGYVSDQMILAATRNGAFRVVDRDLKALAQEQKLQLSDLFDVTETVPFGKLLGADALVVAKLNVTTEGAELYAKLVRVETGEILSAAKVKVTGALGGS